jgi:cell division protein FtsB
LLAIAAVIGAAYIVGSPPAAAEPNSSFVAIAPDRLAAAATAGPAMDVTTQSSKSDGGTAIGMAPGAVPAAGAVDQSGTNQSAVVAAADARQIIKTGQLSLEVTDIAGAISKSEAAISGSNGLGGSIESSTQSGSGDETTAAITFKVPADKWDAAIAALRNIGGKVLSQQTGTNDVTASVVDLNARIDNLQKTEAALQAIMARATLIADVITVENQLSLVQGQIEELTAERDSLKTQAAMSTLTVSYQLPAKTVTTQATEGWTISKQIDIAGAALVRIGQGLATMAVWLVVVILPIGVVLGLLLGILYVVRRVTRRSRGAAAQA